MLGSRKKLSTAHRDSLRQQLSHQVVVGRYEDLSKPRPSSAVGEKPSLARNLDVLHLWVHGGRVTMATIGIRELANHTSAVVDEVNRTGRPTLVTKNGRPVAVLAAIDEEELLDHVLANSPEYVRSMRTAEREITRGTRGRPLEEVLADIEARA